MVGPVSLLQGLRKVAVSGSRNLVVALSGHGLSPKSWHLQFLVEHPKFVAAFLGIYVVLFCVYSENNMLKTFRQYLA
jgi:hypothetical protein